LQKYCGVTTFEELQKVPVEKLMEAHGKLKTRPVSHIIDDSAVQGGFFEHGPPSKTGWIVHPDSKDIPIMIGDAAVEGIIFMATIQKYHPEQLLAGLQKRLPTSFLKHYQLDIDSASPLNTPLHTIIPRMVQFCSDIPFSAPIAKVCSSYPVNKVYSYHWNRGHQFDGGRPKNIANHGVDMNYVFGGHIPHFPEEIDRELSRTAIGNVLTFVYGGEPWPVRGTENLSMVYGEDGKVGMERDENSRRWGAYEEMYKQWDLVREVWNDFLNMRL